jgi:hypothetical protein
MTYKERHWFKPGTRVRVKGHLRAGVRVVDLIYSDIEGGRRLDAPVDGFVSWNVSDLQRADRPTRPITRHARVRQR